MPDWRYKAQRRREREEAEAKARQQQREEDEQEHRIHRSCYSELCTRLEELGIDPKELVEFIRTHP